MSHKKRLILVGWDSADGWILQPQAAPGVRCMAMGRLVLRQNG